MHKDNLSSILPACQADYQTSAPLIANTMTALADRLFGGGNPQKGLRVLQQLFIRRGNRFSFQFTDVVRTEGQVVGVAVSYPGKMLGRLGFSMALQLWKIYGSLEFGRFVRRSLPLAEIREARVGDYFINTLSVAPSWQGQCIGTALLDFLERKAKRLRLRTCALSVDLGNHRARSLYERRGYEVVETIEAKRLKAIGGFGGHHRMVKVI
ncbi:MAG: GNAT family N-acetyltransferase [Anaerolineales bacterium]|nr:GNAT family N-acetyltransferase [Anaerolineales bacterium]